MRKSTCLWLILAALCGAALFRTSQEAHDTRQNIAELARNIDKEENAVRVLEAEWIYLNQPQRLERLAAKHLKLSALRARQIANLNDIPVMQEQGQNLEQNASIKEMTAPKAMAAPQATAVSKAAPPRPPETAPDVKTATKKESKPAAKPAQEAAAKPPRDFNAVLKTLGVR